MYLPSGSEWYSFAMRRVGENAANLRFVFSAPYFENKQN